MGEKYIVKRMNKNIATKLSFLYVDSSFDLFPNSVLGIPLFGEVITVSDMEVISVDSELLPNDQMLWFVNYAFFVFVLSSFQELACRESRVLCWWFIDLETVIVEVVCDDELADSVLWLWIVKHSSEA